MHIINLLPKEKQRELRFEGMLHSILLVIGISVVVFLLVFVVQFGTKVYLETESSSIQKQIADLQKQVDRNDNAQLKAQIKTINDTVNDFNNLVASTPQWSNLLKAFAALPPAEVSVNTLVVDAQTKTVNITGYSPTRDLVLQLRQNILNDTEHFSDIDFPLENIAQPTDVPFHFTFKVKDSVLK